MNSTGPRPVPRVPCCRPWIEHEVTIEGQTYALPEPFSSWERRTRMSRSVQRCCRSRRWTVSHAYRSGFPGASDPAQVSSAIVNMTGGTTFDFHSLRVLATPEQLCEWQRKAAGVHVAEAVSEYILDLFEGARTRGGSLSPGLVSVCSGPGRPGRFLMAGNCVARRRSGGLPSGHDRSLAQFSRVPGDPREAATMARSLLDQTRSR